MEQEQATELLNQCVARFYRIHLKAAQNHSTTKSGEDANEWFSIYQESQRAIEFLCNNGEDMSVGMIGKAGDAALKAIGQ